MMYWGALDAKGRKAVDGVAKHSLTASVKPRGYAGRICNTRFQLLKILPLYHFQYKFYDALPEFWLKELSGHPQERESEAERFQRRSAKCHIPSVLLDFGQPS